MIKKQFLRFIVVGLVSTSISYSAFFIALRLFFVQYLLSSCIGFVVGVFVGFSLNKNWTFSSKTIQSKKIIIGYFSVYVLSLIHI